MFETPLIREIGFIVIFVAIIFAVAWYLPKLSPKVGGVSKSGKEDYNDKPLTQVIGQKYQNTTIILDWHEYINCEFEHCTIRWNGGKYVLKDCKAKEGKVVFETQSRDIINTVYLLKTLNILEQGFADTLQLHPPEYLKKD